MKKCGMFVAITFAAISLLILSACGSSFEYDKEAYVKSAQKFIEVANTKEYQAVVDTLPSNLQSQISDEALREAWDPLLSSSGAFIEYEDATTTGVTQNGVNYVVVAVPCKYENGTLTFTITYTADLEIAALEMK